MIRQSDDFLNYLNWQVLGQDPYAKCCLLDTRDLATEIMRQMGVAEDTDLELYIRHLTLLVIL